MIRQFIVLFINSPSICSEDLQEECRHLKATNSELLDEVSEGNLSLARAMFSVTIITSYHYYFLLLDSLYIKRGILLSVALGSSASS